MKELSIKEYGPEDFARVVVTKEFFESKSNTWVKSFYSFLNGKQYSLYSSGRGKDDGILRKKPIIRLANGKHTEPFDATGKPKVFLPVVKKKVPYDTIHPEVISSKPALEFIKDKLGMKQPDLLDEIREHIIPLYKIGVASFPTNEKHLEHVEFMLDVYHKGKEIVKSELIELIKSEGIYFFRVIELNTGKSYYGRADNCYFQDTQLKEYFRFTGKVYFLNDEFYSSVSLMLLHDIARRCGVSKYVRKISFNPNFSEEKKSQLRLNSSYRSDEITRKHRDQAYDYTLQGFNDIFKQGKIIKSDSLLIWNILLDFIKYESNKEDLFRGFYWWFRNQERSAYFTSQILLNLKSVQWLYSKQNICSRPNEITLNSLSEDYNIGSEEARFLIDKLQFKTEAEDAYLQQMPEEKRNEYLEAVELIRLSKESGIDYKTLLQQRIEEQKRSEYEVELNEAPPVENVVAEEILFEGFNNVNLDVSVKEDNGNQENNNENNAENSATQLPQDIKNKIGHRGERIVFNFLKNRWNKKATLINETESELIYQDKEGHKYTITHLNNEGKKGIGCDILIKNEETIYEYIEVKSSKLVKKDLFPVNGYQWSLAYKIFKQGEGNKFFFYVVKDALNAKPIVTPIKNPIKKWKDGELKAHPVNLEL